MRWIVLVQTQDKFKGGAHWTTESLSHANLYPTEFAIVSQCGPVVLSRHLGPAFPKWNVNGHRRKLPSNGNAHIWTLSMVGPLSTRPPLSHFPATLDFLPLVHSHFVCHYLLALTIVKLKELSNMVAHVLASRNNG